MYFASKRFKGTVNDEKQITADDRRDKSISLLKQQVLDLNDKFDYFVCMMMKNQKLQLSSMAAGD